MAADIEKAKRSLAANVKALRSQIGLSQEALALSADVDRTYVSQIERAIGNPSLGILCRLASILDVEPWTLIREPAIREPVRRRKS